MIAILTDPHFGARGEAQVFLDAHSAMLKSFFTFVVDNKIKEIWILGDLVDNRKNISSKLLNWINENFTSEIHRLGLKVKIIVGNHDTYYRSTNTPNTIRELFGYDDHFQIVDQDILEFNWESNSVAFVPWLSPENEARCVKQLKSQVYDLVCGHFDIVGCIMLGNTVAEHGLKKSVFKNHKLVLSGHYHKRSINDNIHYIGSPVPINWAESNDEHGWSTIDKDLKLKFHKFDYPLYRRITIDTEGEIDLEHEGHVFYKVNIVRKNEFYFQKWLNKLKEHKIVQLLITEDGGDQVDEIVDLDEQDLKEDLVGLMNKAVDQSSFERGSELKSLLKELHSSVVQNKLVCK